MTPRTLAALAALILLIDLWRMATGRLGDAELVDLLGGDIHRRIAVQQVVVVLAALRMFPYAVIIIGDGLEVRAIAESRRQGAARGRCSGRRREDGGRAPRARTAARAPAGGPLLLDLPRSPQISPYLPISPHI